MRKPNLNTVNRKDAEMFVAADTLASMFKKANIKSPISFEKKGLSYMSMKVEDRNVITDEFINEVDERFEDQTSEWAKYYCDIHFQDTDRGQCVVADAGIFSLKVYTDRYGDYHIVYKEQGR